MTRRVQIVAIYGHVVLAITGDGKYVFRDGYVMPYEWTAGARRLAVMDKVADLPESEWEPINPLLRQTASSIKKAQAAWFSTWYAMANARIDARILQLEGKLQFQAWDSTLEKELAAYDNA